MGLQAHLKLRSSSTFTLLVVPFLGAEWWQSPFPCWLLIRDNSQLVFRFPLSPVAYFFMAVGDTFSSQLVWVCCDIIMGANQQLCLVVTKEAPNHFHRFGSHSDKRIVYGMWSLAGILRAKLEFCPPQNPFKYEETFINYFKTDNT